GGGLAAAAALGVVIAADEAAHGAGAVVLAEVGADRRRRPTMLASDSARRLERALRDAGLDAAARGRLAWLHVDDRGDWLERLRLGIETAASARVVIVHLPAVRWREALDGGAIRAHGALLRAELPAQRSLAALAATELHAAGLPVRITRRPVGRVAARRAIAGLDPGGDATRRAARLATGLIGRPSEAARDRSAVRPRLASAAGQALPLALGGIFALIVCALLLAAFGGAVTGKSRAQRAADLTALSAARSMRDDFDRLFTPARLRDGSSNPAHLSKDEYLDRARRAAQQAALRNDVAAGRLRVEFPDSASFAPLRARAEVEASLELSEGGPGIEVAARAQAEAVPPASASAPADAPTMASGGGYAGPLSYRQGEPMRPDVAAAFDRLDAAARADGLGLIVNSAFRSDAEQAELFAQNPDPQWVAPPGTSLHRCGTELDLGPPAAYAWLAANAPGFGFVKRYSWEPWHFGYERGPAPCSAEGDHVAAEGTAPSAVGSSDGDAAATSLPAFVPSRFVEPIAAAARRWNVSASLLAAQLMAESNFNPFAVSSAGAQGIAQFMPGTAAAYGLGDPFDAEAAIDAQAHLMSDLLAQFGAIPLALAAYNAGPAPVAACDCVPAIPETQAYVARILGLMDGAGAISVAPTLEVRLVE
ncbi:MAG: transglycosylase SLT domain-containing protein, partial [Solirubrobacterales bacterium]|nr:transglycosylase SLT domain-containing protein [Solirubrobacterales bacterium]